MVKFLLRCLIVGFGVGSTAIMIVSGASLVQGTEPTSASNGSRPDTVVSTGGNPQSYAIPDFSKPDGQVTDAAGKVYGYIDFVPTDQFIKVSLRDYVQGLLMKVDKGGLVRTLKIVRLQFPNAMAEPQSGTMVVDPAFLNLVQSESAFLGVIAHETSHIGREQLDDTLKGVIKNAVTQYPGTGRNQAQWEEIRADVFGLKKLHEAGYAVGPMIEALKLLPEAPNPCTDPSADHPCGEARRAYLLAVAQHWGIDVNQGASDSPQFTQVKEDTLAQLQNGGRGSRRDFPSGMGGSSSQMTPYGMPDPSQMDGGVDPSGGSCQCPMGGPCQGPDPSQMGGPCQGLDPSQMGGPCQGMDPSQMGGPCQGLDPSQMGGPPFSGMPPYGP